MTSLWWDSGQGGGAGPTAAGATSQGRGGSQAESRDVPVLGQLCLPPSALCWPGFMAVCGRRAGLITVTLLSRSGRASVRPFERSSIKEN